MKWIALLTAFTGAAFATTPALADRWTTMEEEAISLSYGTDAAAKFEIFCGDSSEIVVPQPSGTKPGGDVVFSYTAGGKTKSIILKPDICGGETQCTDRADGDVSSYSLSRPSKKAALTWANSPSFTVKGPAIDLAMDADADVFKTFVASCTNRE